MIQRILPFFTILLLSYAFGQNSKAPSISFSICESSFVQDSGFQKLRVCMHASDTGAYHSRGQVYLKINGKGLNGIPDSAIIVRHLALMNGTMAGLPMPQYETINSINTGTMVVLTWQAKNLGQLADSRMHTRVPTEATGLYEILIPAKSALQFSLSPDFMRGQTFYITPEDKMEKPFGEGKW